MPAPTLNQVALKWSEYGRARADEVFANQISELKRQSAFLAQRAKAMEAVAAGGGPLAGQLLVQAPAGFLIAQGDSWFSYGSGANDIPGLLMAQGYEVNREAAHAGSRIYDMATVGLDAFLTIIGRALTSGRIPKAILLSGGGNDVGNRKTMPDVLLPATPAKRGVNMPELRKVIDGDIQNAYVAILDGITQTCLKYLPKPIPILVHGYDHPVPDGRPVLFCWLKPGFDKRGYPNLEENKGHMVTIIDTFNDMILRLPTLQDGQGKRRFEHVVHVEVRGALSTKAADYQQDWSNELHPTQPGFAKVTDKFVKVLERL